MAPKKKKKKEYQPKTGGSSPVVVIFLVFFILLSIGLGVACYYGYAGQAEYEKKAKDAAKDKAAALKDKEWAEFQAREMRDAFGAPLHKDEKIDEFNFLKVGRDKFEGKEFEKEPLAAVFQKAVDESRKILGWDKNGQRYLTTYQKKIQDLQNELNKTQADVAKAKTEEAKANKLYRDLQTQYDQEYKDIKALVVKGNKEALDKVTEKIKKMDEVLDQNVQLRADIDKLKVEHAKALREKDKSIVDLVTELEKAQDKLVSNKPKVGGGPQPGAGKQHALMLDISKGRPLWDQPKGKILKIDWSRKEVLINLGKADGAEKELTFNVFSPGWNNEALGQLRGTIEIQDVLDEGQSLARITSMFDSTGKEIPLYDPFKGAAQRQAENPMKEGDLLFNTFWKSRVALAGKFNFSSYVSPNPAEDLRKMKLFMAYLKKHDIAVDAYIDLTTGKIEGAITPETRFLILGEPATKGFELLGKTPNPELPKMINSNIDELKKQAVDKGMFMISSYNFAFVMGYRPPQSADSTTVSTFQSSLPAGGDPKLIAPPEGGKTPPGGKAPGNGPPPPAPGAP